MEQPRMTNEQMIAAFRDGDMSATSMHVIGDRLRNGKAASSKLSVRVDKDGAMRWFHQTKGWRGLAVKSA